VTCGFDRFIEAIGERLDEGAGVPLLVLRLPEFERIAWREGLRAARRVLREGDALAHACGSDRFAVAMLAPGRAPVARPPEPNEIRSALLRVASVMSLSTGRSLQAGWWPVETRAELETIGVTLDAALERGSRERERREVLAMVGHELRTPLTSIRGYIEALLDAELDPSTTRRFLETARGEALRLGRMVEGMLEFSLLDLSTRRPRGRCDVAEQVRVTVDAIGPLARKHRVNLRALLPQTAALACVDGDACMHALMNLVENGIKCGGTGGTVEITCDRDGSFVRICVDDDGPGVPAGERESIFAMGARGNAARHPGTGIGLAVVTAIAESAGGDVRVRSSTTLGGACFVLRFPAG
jgi:signal transduction histidine kinase